MIIRVSDLEKIFDLIIKKLQFEGVESIDLGGIDFYWEVDSSDWTNFGKKVEASVVGSLRDDVKSLKELLKDKDRPTTYVDFDRVAAVLRFISEKQNPGV